MFAILSDPTPNLDDLKMKMSELISVFDDLRVRNAEIVRELASANLPKTEVDAEYFRINKYHVMTKQLRDLVQQMDMRGATKIPHGEDNTGRKFELPKIQLTKFSRHLKDYVRNDEIFVLCMYVC